MKRVILRGPFTIAAGYGVHARQIAKWFYENQTKYDLDIKFELTPWGECYSIVDTAADNGFIGWIYQNMISSEQELKTGFDLSVQVQLPNEWNPKLAKYNIGVTAGVETTLCNPKWIECINQMSSVIVPSEFVKQTFLTTAKATINQLTTEITVIPESFDAIFEKDRFDNLNGNNIVNLDADFNFLLFGQLTGNNPFNDRKNVPFALKWFIEEFKGNPNVGLVLKTGYARGHHIDRRMTAVTFQQYLLDLGYDSVNDPRITVIHGSLAEEEVGLLFKHPKIKALYMPTRGEGFGLPLVNAAAAGMPIMATNWSAHTEFLNQGKWIKMDYELKNVHESRVDNNIFFKESQWAEPIERDVKARLRKFYNDHQMPKQWALDLQSKVRQSHSFATIKTIYDQFFNSKLTS
jgi:glycosyltransferase involved in cell wall biosynthesis